MSRKTPQRQAAEASFHSAAVEFDHFSFWYDEQDFITISVDHREDLRRYLDHEFGITDFMMSGPYPVLYCTDVPDVDTRPLTIAGSIAVWLEKEEAALPAALTLGDLGDGPDVVLDGAIAGELRPYRLPTPSTLAVVARSFTSERSM